MLNLVLGLKRKAIKIFSQTFSYLWLGQVQLNVAQSADWKNLKLNEVCTRGMNNEGEELNKQTCAKF